MAEPILDISGVSKAFPGVQALDRVSMDLRPGEIHALIGENGAGKSTLIKIITGVERPDAGDIRLNGQTTHFATPRDAMAAGIGAVHQERNLITRFTVGENIMLERPPARLGLVDFDRVHAEARRWLDLLDLPVDPRTSVSSLSVAQMQIVEIAKALSLQSKILLMDEPTASITAHETEVLFALLRRLRDDGVTIVFVSHKLEEVMDLCERVTVLRDGKNACPPTPLAKLSRGDLVRLMIGRDEQIAVLGDKIVQSDTPALQLTGVSTGLGHDGIDLSVQKGEIVGLYGLVGSGRTELAKAIIGAAPITGGTVSVKGAPASIANATDALQRHRIGYVSEDRKQEGLILIHSVARNIGVTIWTRLAGLLGLLTDRRERDAVAPFVTKLDIRTPSVEQIAGNLSGGNQQKVSVAKWLAAEVETLIVDEPTVGVDIRTKAYLHELIWKLAADGTAILLISSDMPEMIELADRILVMNDFRIVGELDNSRDYDAMSHRIMAIIHDEEPDADAPVPDIADKVEAVS
ncbi:MAG: sugar ABC transporter ATP-binding protein [Inquilinus sp.]|nr:sugar ABC transporter ATP-binding protein [Inquilinus sp.]